jgi:hypothetical protein
MTVRHDSAAGENCHRPRLFVEQFFSRLCDQLRALALPAFWK